MNIAQTLKLAITLLRPTSTTPNIDAELLLAEALKTKREYLFAYPEKLLSSKQLLTFAALLMRRINGEPIAYILGKREFWSLQLAVNKNVLIPRHETELLIETALKTLTSNTATVADLGTGSGAIALALAKEKPKWQIFATDKSRKALNTARDNAKKHQLHNVTFCYGSWCHALPDIKFDALISNPPYITKDDFHALKGDTSFEPKQALLAGADGLSCIKIICQTAQKKLTTNGLLMFEHGHKQKVAVSKLMQKHNFINIETFRDIAGKNRVTVGYKK